MKVNDIEWCTVEMVERALKDEKYYVVDIRDNEVYSGWTLEKNDQGGHIPGAWDIHILEELAKDDKIILCGNDKSDIVKRACNLQKEGYQNVRAFILQEWIKEKKELWSVYPRYDLFIPAKIVKQMLENIYPREIVSKGRLCIFNIGWGNEAETGYVDGHVPQAVHINSDEFEPPKEYIQGIKEWRLATDEKLAQILNKYGIDQDCVVIVTGNDISPACRFAVICKYMGIDSVYVMSRGNVGWKEAGFSFEKGSSCINIQNKKCVAEYSTKNSGLVLTIEEVKKHLYDSKYEWVDIREWDEFKGENTGYDYHKIAGTIKNAKFGCLNHSCCQNNMLTYRNCDRTMKNPRAILKIWKDNAIDLEKKLVFFCGGGWRASEVLWDAMVMGQENVAIIGDGWIAWSNEGNPCDNLKIFR